MKQLAFALALLSLTAASDSNHRVARTRLLYVTDASGLSVYDIDRGHAFVRKIPIANSGAYKGIGASPPLGLLYVTSNTGDELIALSLATDSVVWRRNVGKYADSFWVTPDGKHIWMPLRGGATWVVLDAAKGSTVGEVETERGKRYDVDPIQDIGPHNTWMNLTGTRAYLEILTVPYIYIADARTPAAPRVLGKIGPFTKGIRPFAVSDNERTLYANVDGLLGFEIADIDRDFRGGRMVRRVEARTPPERLAEIPAPPRAKPHSTPSHGLNLHPNQREVWMVDGVYGYIYVFDVAQADPKQIASIPVFADPKERPHPGWITFSIDGTFAYPDGGVVIDTRTKKVVARIPTSEKLIEVDFDGGKVIAAGASMTVRPAIAGLCPLLQVFDMPTSIAFYRDVLGFTMVSSSSPGDTCDWCWLQSGASNLMLNTAYESDSRPAAPDAVRVRSHEDIGLFFSCADAAAMHAYLRSRGINAEEPEHQGYGMTQVYLRDPDGYVLCFQHPIR